ncbi:MAG: sugar ABC transporter permease [Chloroflexi bacterium]|nr:sugar ABC transporter permease [Chloroflexota bacterium]
MIGDWRERLRIPVMLMPAMAVVIVLFMGGLVMGLMQSFEYMPVIGKNDFTVQAYVNIFTDRTFLRSLGLTCWIGFASTILSTILAIVCALVLRQDLPGKRFVTFVFQLNVPIPHVVGAIAVMFLFTQSGLLARIGYLMKLISEPADFPALVYDKRAIGIILEYLWKATPFTGIIVLAVLQSIGEDYEDLARTLGANAWQRFRYVVLPLIMPGVLRSSVLVFAFTFGAFEVPYLLGQTFPTALPVLSYLLYHDVDLNARPEAMAMSMIIAGLITVLILIYMKLTETYVRTD